MVNFLRKRKKNITNSNIWLFEISLTNYFQFKLQIANLENKSASLVFEPFPCLVNSLFVT